MRRIGCQGCMLIHAEKLAVVAAEPKKVGELTAAAASEEFEEEEAALWGAGWLARRGPLFSDQNLREL